MIDCKLTVNFLREKDRMCKCYKNDKIWGCINCPMSYENNGKGKCCSEIMFSDPEYAIKIVQGWSNEHPIKTRLDDVKEKYPNVEMVDGTPMFYPLRLGYCKDCDKCIVRGLIKRCWDEPVDGGATGREVE